MKKIEHIVFTAGINVVTSSKLKNAITAAINEGCEEIYFYISSPGGNIFEGLSVAAIIRALPIKTTMHNIGQVDSVATAIFSAGREKLSNKNASFMFHGVSITPPSQPYLEQQLKEMYKQSKRMKDDIANAISHYSDIPLTDISLLMKDGGSILSATEAKDSKLIDDIVEAKIPKDVKIISINNT